MIQIRMMISTNVWPTDNEFVIDFEKLLLPKFNRNGHAGN
jgi:hypothetical protein